MSVIYMLISLALVLLLSGSVSSRWCTRLKSEKQVQTFIEYAQCNQSYQAACGWFTRQQCTFYELVDCPKERNQTVVRYKIVEECCRGYDLDPINNITCIKKKGGHEASVHYYESDDGLFLGLSHGAYAGIICSFLFVVCVVVLIALHVVKKKRRSKANNQSMEMNVTEKMIPALQT